MMNRRKIHFEFFPKQLMSSFVERLSGAITVGRNLQLVGLPGSGKSLALRKVVESKLDGGRVKVAYYDMGLLPELTREELLKKIELEMERLQNGDRLVLLLDSFDEIVGVDHVTPLLKSIYTKYRGSLTIVFAVEQPIENKDSVYGDVYFIEPLKDKNLEWYWKGVVSAYGLSISSQDRKIIFEKSGGFPAIIKRLVECRNRGHRISDVIENPNLDLHLTYQLELMSESLGKRENYYVVPIFDRFMEIKSGTVQPIDEVGSVKIKSRLTKLEHSVLSVLWEKRMQLVNRDEMVVKVWGSNAVNGVADHALDQVIYRLSKKLGESNSGWYVETVRGRGHLLRRV